MVKVECSQKTDNAECYVTVDLSASDLNALLAQWQHYYNWERSHNAHNGKTPVERYFELVSKRPIPMLFMRITTPAGSIYKHQERF